MSRSAATSGSPSAKAGGEAASQPVAEAGRVWVFGDFVLDATEQRLTHRGRPVALAPRYFSVLQYLAGSSGRLVGKDELLDAVWGHRHVSDSVLKVAMNALRKALDDDPRAPRFIETVARRGYRFTSVDRVEAPPVAVANQAGGVVTGRPAAPPPALPSPANQTAGPVLGNLPALQPGLIGRDDDLRALHAAMAQHRLVTLHGPGGVGKTRLALAAAAGLGAADGVWLLRLDAMADAGPLLPALARLLSLGAGAGTDAATLARALGSLQAVLVLDNAEHVAGAVTALATSVLAAAPGVRLLVTSQVPLHVDDEQVLPLAPLPWAAPEEPQAEPSAALQLLLARVRQQQPDVTLGPAQRADALAICSALDGLPLALELAAARVPLLGWAGVRARLTAAQGLSLSVLNRGRPSASERHRTLHGALAWTFALLSPPQQRVLQGLSVFAGSFSVEAAVAVVRDEDQAETDAVIDHLDALREHALLVPVDAGGAVPRWRLFDSVRSFAAQSLDASGGRKGAMQRLVDHLIEVFRASISLNAKMPVKEWVELFEPEIDTLRVALQAALAEPTLQEGGQWLCAVSTLYRVRAGWRVEALRDLRAAQALLPQPPGDRLLRAEMDLAAAYLCAAAQLLPVPEGLAAARRARDVFREVGDVERETLALTNEYACLIRRPSAQSLEERQQCITRMQSIELPAWTALQRRYRLLASLHLLRDQGHADAHNDACSALMSLGRAFGDPSIEREVAHSLGMALFARGQIDEAAEVLGRNVSDLRAAGLLRANAHALALWASVSIVREGTPQTVAALREAAERLHAEGRLWWLADALAWPLAWKGRWRDAVRVQAWADGLVRQLGEQRGPVFGGIRKRFGAWLDTQPLAAELQALLSETSLWDESVLLALVFEGGGAGGPPL